MTGSGPLEEAAVRLGAVLPVRRDVSFAELTTYRLGGPAAVVVGIGSLAAAEALMATLPPDLPTLVVGRGSNLLVADEGFAGIVITLEGDLARLDLGGSVPAGSGPAGSGRVGPDGGSVLAGGGLALPQLARRTAAAGLTGLEFFVGIPGSVGGAVRMNAGGHGRDTSEVLRRAWVADLAGAAIREMSLADLEFGYRSSALPAGGVVLRAELAVARRPAADCEAEIDAVVRWRRAHQPGGANAGSVFTNPPGDSAGRLIDACGLKGFAAGGVRVSERHANFFQAEAGARAADVVDLIVEVQRRVEAATGIRLQPELRRAGFAGEPGAAPGAPPAWPLPGQIEACR